jgi:cellulose synthase operon protein C
VAPFCRYALLWFIVAGCLYFGRPLELCAQSTPVAADWGEDQYAIAAQHYRQQRWQQAIGQFQLLLEREPNHTRSIVAKFFLAESQVQLEQYEDCLDHFRAFLAEAKDHPLSMRAKFRLGEAYYLLGRDDESIRELSELLNEDKEQQFTEFTLAYLGEMLLKREMPASIESARDYLQRVVREFPNSSLLARSQLGLAQAFQKLGEVEAAESLLRTLQQSLESSIAEEATLILVALWIDRGQPQEVLATLDDATLAGLSSNLQPKAKYWRGRAEMAVKNWTKAGALILDSAPQLEDPRLQQAAWYDAAICFWQADNLTQAERLLQQSIEKWPTGDWAAESRFLLLQAAVREQQSEDISSQAEAFLAQFPDHSLANKVRETLGRRALNQRDHALSAAQFQMLLSTTIPTSENSLDRANWHYLLALSQIGLQNLDQGLESLNACVQLLPAKESLEANVETESLDDWLQASTTEESEVAVRTSEEQLREQADFARASILMRQGKWTEALSAQAQILRDNPRSSHRVELMADRLRALVAIRDWSQWTKAVETSKIWLSLSEVSSDGVATEQPTSANQVLSKALTSTALTVADHWYDNHDYTQAISWYDLAATAADAEIAEQALSGLAWAEFQSRPTAESEATARVLLDRFSTSPRSAEIGLKLAEQKYRDGKFEAADELLQTLLGRFPDWPRRHQLHALHAKLLARNVEPAAKQQAIEALNAALSTLEAMPSETSDLQEQKWTSTATYVYELAWLYHDSGQTESANRAFERINVNHPTSRYWADATIRLAQAHFSQGRLPAAIDLLQQLIGEPRPAEVETEEVRTPAGVPALSASFRNSEGDSDTHVMNGAETQHSIVSEEIKCQALYLRAMIAVAEKDWPSAATWSQRVVDEYPKHRLRWMSQFWNGEALFRQRQFGMAVEQLSEVLPRTDAQNDPWVAMAHLRLAQSLGHLDRWEEVLVIAEPAKRRFVDFAQAYELDYLIGRALATEARFPQARAAYQQVIDSPAGKTSETAAMAQWMIGETYFHQEQYALAAEAYHRTETLHRFPQWQAAALLQAGKCYEYLSRPQDAISVYRQLLQEHANCTLAEQAAERMAKLKPTGQTTLVPSNPLPQNRLRGL